MGLKTVFLHGRPGPYPLHGRLASAVGAEFMPIDFLLRWHDVPSPGLRKYLSWFLCAMLFPRVGEFHTILCDSVHFLPPLMRRLGRLRRDQRIVAFLSDETPFFLREHRYRPLTERALRLALLNYDALVCFGAMEERLAVSLLDGAKRPLMLSIRGGGVGRERTAAFGEVRPHLAGREVLFVGFGPAEWRGWYKGLDLAVQAVALASAEVGSLSLKVVGDWDREYVDALRRLVPPEACTLVFAGKVWDLSRLAKHFAEAALYVHLGRGDAFPHSVLEAMWAGVPCIVSEWTGTREAVEQVDSRLVVPCDPRAAAERIRWYFRLSLAERQRLSVRTREVAAQYTEDEAAASFVREYRRMVRGFGLPDLAPDVIDKRGEDDARRWWPVQD